MKKLLLLLLLIPQLAFAKSLKDLSIKMVPQREVNQECANATDRTYASEQFYSCYVETKMGGQFTHGTIYLPSDGGIFYGAPVPPVEWMAYAYWFELGRFYFQDAPLSAIHRAFDEPADWGFTSSTQKVLDDYAEMQLGVYQPTASESQFFSDYVGSVLR